MKVSLNAVKYYLGGEVWPSVDDLVQKIGAQLGAVEEVVEYGKRYEGIVVAKVVECVKHPNADKLSVCKIDVGKDELVQVVCGAPNVRQGLIVAWIPPGATVPATYDKDPFVLDARELRGEMSNGMLASASELGISNDHSGLLEIDPSVVGEEKTKPGTPFKNLYGLDDWVIDLENKMFTHRPDCFGVLGVAREFAGIYSKKFETAEWYWRVPQIFLKSSDQQKIDTLQLEVKNEIPELVPRFMAVAMSDVKVGPSPIWVQALLNRVGIKSINNIVDLTNHLAYVTGQPLHAYDYDKVKDLGNGLATLIVRQAKQGDKLKLLNGKEVEPVENTIMIATDKEPIGIAGVMGGSSTEVDENTKNIIIECANFDMYTIRRASMVHGLFTDAVTRFTKGQSPLQTDRVIVKMMEDVIKIAGAKQASEVIDIRHIDEAMYNRQTVNSGVIAPVDFINSRLGLNLSKEEIMALVRNVEFACLEEGEEGEIEFHAPFWRTDIEIKEDVVEEVGRLYGYDKLPKNLPRKRMAPSQIDPDLVLKSKIRHALASMGANEVLTYSFVHGKLIENAGQDPAQAFKLSNAISPDLQYYRLSLTPSLLNLVHPNIKAGHDKFALFELGKVHNKKEFDGENPPKEVNSLSYIFANEKKEDGSAFYKALLVLRQLLDKNGISSLKLEILEGSDLYDNPWVEQNVGPFEPSRSAVLRSIDDSIGMTKNLIWGVVGEYKQSVIKSFKLPEYCAGFEIDPLMFSWGSTNNYVPLSRYPAVSQDICLEVDKNLAYAELEKAVDNAIVQAERDLVTDKELIDIYSDEKLGDKKRITFRIKFVSYDRTLTEDSINQIMADVESKLSQIAKRI